MLDLFEIVEELVYFQELVDIQEQCELPDKISEISKILTEPFDE